MHIPLGNGMFARVDESDYERIAEHRWYARRVRNCFYAERAPTARERLHGRKSNVLMHREILDAKAGQTVDHRDCDGLNNTRANLRFCTRNENMRNSRIRRNNKSGFKGVYRNAPASRARPWRAQIRVDGKLMRLGYFATPEEAHRAYCDTAKRMHGEFWRPL